MTLLAFVIWFAGALVIEGPELLEMLGRHGRQRGAYVNGVYTRDPNGRPWWRRRA